MDQCIEHRRFINSYYKKYQLKLSTLLFTKDPYDKGDKPTQNRNSKKRKRGQVENQRDYNKLSQKQRHEKEINIFIENCSRNFKFVDIISEPLDLFKIKKCNSIEWIELVKMHRVMLKFAIDSHFQLDEDSIYPISKIKDTKEDDYIGKVKLCINKNI